MASREGNVVVAPGFYDGETYKPVEILASTVGLYQKGCTLKPGQGVLEAGTVLVRGDGGLYEKAADATAADNAQGVLRLGVDTGGSPDAKRKLGVIVRQGILKRAPLVAANGTGGDAIVTAAVQALGGTEVKDNPADPNHYIVKF